jgi:hypothetical protein
MLSIANAMLGRERETKKQKMHRQRRVKGVCAYAGMHAEKKETGTNIGRVTGCEVLVSLRLTEGVRTQSTLD